MDEFVRFLTVPGSETSLWMAAPRTAIIILMAIAYARLAKKRFIAQASPMDLVTAILFGSLLSRGINGNASLASTLIAGGTVVAIHRVLIHFGAASPAFGWFVKGTYNTLVSDGKVDWDAMRQHDISEADLRLEMRLNGHLDDLANIRLATLERNGRISIITRDSPAATVPRRGQEA